MRREVHFWCLPPVAIALSVLLPAQVQDLDILEECTVGVACGKATPDNRPLLWKTRDTNAKNNEVVYFTDGKYKYLALVTAGQDSSAWAGVNEKGFCIMNSLSTDLPRGERRAMGNGGFMKLALRTCATVADLEAMLVRTAETGRRTRANFGVIDATGAAMVFETGATTHKRFDASDPKVAPEGFIVRSNFAMSADNARTRARSIERYQRGNSICKAAVAKENLTARHLLRQFCRDLADSDGKPFSVPLEQVVGKAPAGMLDNNKCIARPSTRSAVVFHGVRAPEHPDLTTFWVVLGEPIFSVAVPCWVRTGAVAPELDGEEHSPLCDAAISLTADGYITRRKEGRRSPARYLNTKELPKIWERTYPAEDEIFKATAEHLKTWRNKLPPPEKMLQFHQAMAKQAHTCLKNLVTARSGVK
ncbi:MAG: peptidase C45 [Planctomycetota bacterium]|nr:peptidase C45 [Planctomycetota bacterium]